MRRSPPHGRHDTAAGEPVTGGVDVVQVLSDAPVRSGRPGPGPAAPATQLYDELPDGVVVVDHTGRVCIVNTAAEALLGVQVGEASGRDYRDVLPLSDPQGRDWWVCTMPYDGLPGRTRQPERLLTLALPGGGTRDLLVAARYVRERPAGPLVRLVVTLRDAAPRTRAERSSADLISTVAHELRSPLTSVKGFTATLLAKWGRFTDEAKLNMLQAVNTDADRVTRLLTELLDVSRIDAGRLELRKQVVDLPAKVRAAVAGKAAAGEPAERFSVTVDGELPELWLDPDKVDQILANLLENAVNYGSGVISVEISGAAAGAGLVIHDEGEGIPEEMLAMVFTKFWRRRDGAVRRAGTGLGLYIVKGLVEAHGGTITAGRGQDGGAEFRLTLPAGAPPYLDPA